MPRGVEVKQVAQLEAKRVANQPISLPDLPKTFLGHDDVVAIVLRGHPQTQHVRAIVLHIALGRLRLQVPALALLGLRYLFPVLVHHEPMRQHRPVGRTAITSKGQQKRRLEPAPVLVRSLKVNVRNPALVPAMGQLRSRHQDRPRRRSRVDPNIQRVLRMARRHRPGPALRPASIP